MALEQSSQWIVETTAKTFETDVFERSRKVPVVVDFWAPWCGPCRTLGPVLERLANEFAGKFVLVKANVDQLPEAAASFQVSGIPAVFAVQNEQVVDFFSGALPEAHVREWLNRVLAASTLETVRDLEQKSPGEAIKAYRKILADDPKNADAKLGLARVLMETGKLDEARTLIDELENHGFLDAEGQKVKASLELRSKHTNDLSKLRAEAEADPDNLEAQLAFAEALAGDEKFAESLELLLSLFQRDKKGIGPRARELMVQIMQALPDDSELATTYRRKLSMAMY